MVRCGLIPAGGRRKCSGGCEQIMSRGAGLMGFAKFFVQLFLYGLTREKGKKGRCFVFTML